MRIEREIDRHGTRSNESERDCRTDRAYKWMYLENELRCQRLQELKRARHVRFIHRSSFSVDVYDAIQINVLSEICSERFCLCCARLVLFSLCFLTRWTTHLRPLPRHLCTLDMRQLWRQMRSSPIGQNQKTRAVIVYKVNYLQILLIDPKIRFLPLPY